MSSVKFVSEEEARRIRLLIAQRRALASGKTIEEVYPASPEPVLRDWRGYPMVYPHCDPDTEKKLLAWEKKMLEGKIPCPFKVEFRDSEGNIVRETPIKLDKRGRAKEGFGAMFTGCVG